MPTKNLHVKQSDLAILKLIANGYTAKRVAQFYDCQYHVIAGRIEDLRVEFEAKNTCHLIVILMLKNILQVEMMTQAEKAEPEKTVYSNQKSLYGIKY